MNKKYLNSEQLIGLMMFDLSEVQLDSLRNFYENEGQARFKTHPLDEIIDKINSIEPTKTNSGYIWAIKRAKGIELNIETNKWKFHGLGFH